MTANLKTYIHPVRHHKIYGEESHLMSTTEVTLLPASLWVDAQIIMTNLCRNKEFFDMRNQQGKRLKAGNMQMELKGMN